MMKLEEIILLNSNCILLVKGGTLVVCPSTLCEQWKCEAEDRSKPNSLAIIWYNKSNCIDAFRLSAYDMVLVSYDLLSAESESASKSRPLFEICWARTVLDEAHRIRNSATKISMACYNLESINRWAVTGTPIQNSLLDLFSLLKFLEFKPFDEKRTFKELYMGKSKDFDKLNLIIDSILLRRTKHNVNQKYNELSPLQNGFIFKEKIIVEKYITLTNNEMDIYLKILTQSHLSLAKLMARCVKSKTKKKIEQSLPTDQDKVSLVNDVLVFITRLRQICVHPCLIEAVSFFFINLKFNF